MAGAIVGQHDDRQKLPSSSTSTGSKIPVDAIHIWVASARSRSRLGQHSQISDSHETITSPEGMHGLTAASLRRPIFEKNGAAGED